MKNLFKLNLLTLSILTLLTFPLFAQNSGTTSINEPLKIIFAPQPSFTETARKTGACGSVVLSLTFGATSQIDGYTIISGLADGLTETAVDAALKIRFIPARKGGLTISVNKKIKYNFHSDSCKSAFTRDGMILEFKKPGVAVDVIDSQLIVEVFDEIIGKGTGNDPSEFSLTDGSKTPVIILKKPIPDVPQHSGSLDVSGIVKLRVTFQANGEISEITPISKLCCGLDEKAIEAAKKIEFKPATKSGQAITVSQTIIYEYASDRGWLTEKPLTDEKAEAILKTAIEKMGGERYLSVKTSTGRGNFTSFRDGEAVSFSSFIDYIAFPDKERTEFKSSNGRIIQTNFGDGGWMFDGEARTIKDQTKEQIVDFQESFRRSLDYLLRGSWRKTGARLNYAGRRPASLGKRNETITLTFADGFAIDFEFSVDSGLPIKSTFKRKDAEGKDVTEEERFGQIVEIQGIYTPFIIDHFINGKQSSRVNYQTIEFNSPISDALFAKPTDLKKLK